MIFIFATYFANAFATSWF